MSEQTTDANEDWIRSMHWDLPVTMPALLQVLGVSESPPDDQRAALRHLMTLPAWKPAPDDLRTEVIAFTRTGTQ